MDFIPEEINAYVIAHSQPEPELLQQLSQETWQTVSVNALGFAGALLVRNREQFAQLEDIGPMRLLQEVGVTRD